MNRIKASWLIGLLFILIGLFISAEQLIGSFRSAGIILSQELALGAILFKVGLVVSGSYIILVRYFAGDTKPEEIIPPGPDKSSYDFGMILLGLMTIAFILRLYNLNIGIWFDEMLTHVHYMPMTLGEIASTYDDANNHLLFTLAARISLSIFGDSIWAFRLPAVIFGVASTGALYYFARQVSSAKESLFATALFTFSYHHIWFSQNARGYTALLFFTLLSSSLLLSAIRKNSSQQWLLYAIAVCLGAYTHVTIAFVVVAHFAIYVMCIYRNTHDLKNKWHGLLYGFIPVALMTFQAYALLLPSMLGGGLLDSGLQSEEEVAWTNPVWALMEIVQSMKIGFTNGGIALAAGIIFSVGVIDFARKRPAVISLLFIPVVLGFFIMVSIGYTLFPRFFFFTMGFGVVVVIRGAVVTGNYIGQLIGLPKGRSTWLATALCTAIVLSSLLSMRYVFYPKQDFVSAIDFIEKEKQPGDNVITVGIADFPFREYYKKDWQNVKNIDELNSIMSSDGRTWLIYIMPVHSQAAYPGIIERIKQDYTEVQRFYGTLNGGEIVVNIKQ